MNKHKAKRAALKRRQRRVRAKIFGTAERPRLTVHRTNAHIYAQVIDDADSKTICSASTLSSEFRETGKLGSNKEAVRCDRGGCIYHGRVKALADGARAAGLKF